MTDLSTDGTSTGCSCPGGCAEASPAGRRSRRDVLRTGGVVVAAAAVSAACGSSAASPSSNPTVAGSAPGGGGASSPAGSSGGGGGLATTDVPVGGGTILADRKIVVTQPTAGQFKAFTAVCTHLGCTVASVADGLIRCPCHGSRFSISDGSVQGGPAPAPLAAVPVTVSGTTLPVG